MLAMLLDPNPSHFLSVTSIKYPFCVCVSISFEAKLKELCGYDYTKNYVNQVRTRFRKGLRERIIVTGSYTWPRLRVVVGNLCSSGCLVPALHAYYWFRTVWGFLIGYPYA